MSRQYDRATATHGGAGQHIEGILRCGGDLELFERNMAAFAEHAPDTHALLSVFANPAASLVGSLKDGTLNIDLGHTHFYEPDAVTFSEKQYDAYRGTNQRLTIAPPRREENPLSYSQKFSEGIYDFLMSNSYSLSEYNPDSSFGYCIIFGIGLGFHIPKLVKDYDFRHLVICEQYFEFLYFSLFFQDWGDVFSALVERGGKIYFIVRNNPESLGEDLYWVLRQREFGLIDGSIVYRHYSSYLLDHGHKILQDRSESLANSKGFFEDELVMLANCTWNLLYYDHRILEDRAYRKRYLPAVIVGSGPSLDESIEELRRIRDKVVVFSCGTGLRVLVKNGIIPDFHCELENGDGAYQAVSAVRAMADLSQITLLASSTVDPRMPEFFASRILYFRDSLSSTHLYGRSFKPIHGTGPTVSNLGVTAAITLGFEEIYLFGVDLGARSAERHHSSQSVYMQDERFKNAALPMTIPARANFGGEARSNVVLHWARYWVQRTLSDNRHIRCFNCSDGARIEGATPKLAKTVNPSADISPAQAVNEILRELESYKKGHLTNKDYIKNVQSLLSSWYDDFIDRIDLQICKPTNMVSVYDLFIDKLRNLPISPAGDILFILNLGTLMTCYQMAAFFYDRLTSDQRVAFLHFCLTAFRNLITELRERILGHFDFILSGFIDEAQSA